jgi:hypothetical protein
MQKDSLNTIGFQEEETTTIRLFGRHLDDLMDHLPGYLEQASPEVNLPVLNSPVIQGIEGLSGSRAVEQSPRAWAIRSSLPQALL